MPIVIYRLQGVSRDVVGAHGEDERGPRVWMALSSSILVMQFCSIAAF